MSHFAFFLGLALLLTHELDAVRQREWTIFPLLTRLDDPTGYLVFTALHVPLFAAIFWYLVSGSSGTLNLGLVRGLSIFCIVHVGLHLLALLHPRNPFTGGFSWLLIGGAGLAGAVDLAVAR